MIWKICIRRKKKSKKNKVKEIVEEKIEQTEEYLSIRIF